MADLEVSVIFYGSLAGFATLCGIYVMIKNQKWAKDNAHYINSFAAGLILALVFFHLIPEAVELSELAYIAIFIGFFAFYLLENFIVIHSGGESHFHQHDDGTLHYSSRMGFMAFSGIGFHSFIDGIIIGVGFEVSSEVGLLASIAVILHEVPEGMTSFALIAETIPEKAKMLSVIVAISTPIGAFVSLIFIHGLTYNIIGVLLSLAAGTFIYVAASDLIPSTHASNNVNNLIGFIIGAAFIYAISVI